MLMERINAPAILVWSVVWRFDKPETYNPFIRSCSIKKKGEIKTGCVREVKVTTGLPAKNNVECLEILDEQNHVLSFKIMGVDHRLRDYRSAISLNEFVRDGRAWTAIAESYVADIPEGNCKEETCMFIDTIVICNAIPIRTRLLDVKTEYSRLGFQNFLTFFYIIYTI
jgi:abscisic acid receptor (PYR/PYL family)